MIAWDEPGAGGSGDVPAEFGLSGLFAGDPPTQFVPLLEAMAADVRRRSMLIALTAMAEADLTSVLPTIAVPTQLIWGALDVRSPLAVAHEFERRIPGAILTVIPYCGHVSHLEAPRAFNDVVRGFLDNLAVPTAHPSGHFLR